MTFSAFIRLFILFGFLCYVGGSSVTFEHSPPSTRFGSASTLWLSELDQVISASLGYTVKGGIWKGLTIKSPFGYPKAFVLLDVKSDGASIRQEGNHYGLMQDISVDSTLDYLEKKLKSQSQNPLHFERIILNKEINEIPSYTADIAALDRNLQIDDDFVHEMEILPSLSHPISTKSLATHGGKDVVYIRIDSFQTLINKHGANSSKVNEAKGVLRKAVSQLLSNLKSLYDDKIVFATIFTESEAKTRTKRQAEAKEGVSFANDGNTINLAQGYSDDYPIVFNIVLFLAIVMFLAVVAASSAMAFMDPGHDSIIYRMTNPRMKKD